MVNFIFGLYCRFTTRRKYVRLPFWRGTCWRMAETPENVNSFLAGVKDAVREAENELSSRRVA